MTSNRCNPKGISRTISTKKMRQRENGMDKARDTHIIYGRAPYASVLPISIQIDDDITLYYGEIAQELAKLGGGYLEEVRVLSLGPRHCRSIWRLFIPCSNHGRALIYKRNK